MLYIFGELTVKQVRKQNVQWILDLFLKQFIDGTPTTNTGKDFQSLAVLIENSLMNSSLFHKFELMSPCFIFRYCKEFIYSSLHRPFASLYTWVISHLFRLYASDGSFRILSLFWYGYRLQYQDFRALVWLDPIADHREKS